MTEPDHTPPRLATVTSLPHTFSPVVTIMKIEPVEPEEAKNVTPLNTESGNNEGLVDDVEEAALFSDEENDDVIENDSPSFSKWELLLFVLTLIGTMMSWAINPHPPKAGFPRGDVCEMFEKPLEQSVHAATMVCAGSALDYANLSLHGFNVQGGSGTTWR